MISYYATFIDNGLELIIEQLPEIKNKLSQALQPLSFQIEQKLLTQRWVLVHLYCFDKHTTDGMHLKKLRTIVLDKDFHQQWEAVHQKFEDE